MGRAEYLEIDGRLGFVEVHGEGGDPVLCVHTAGHSGVQWRRSIPGMVERGYAPVIVDLPGHGRSEPAVNGPVCSLGYYADWCIQVLRSLRVERPYVLGCSIGGKIVMDIAAKISGELSGLISMATYGVRGGLKLSSRPWELEDSSSPSMRDRSYYGHAALLGRTAPPDVVEMIALMHCREDWHVTLCDQTAWGAHDIAADLSKIKCPAYILVGDHDLGVPYKLVGCTAEQIPGARAGLIKGVGHYPMEEMPDFAQRFDEWVKEMTSSWSVS